MGRREQLLRAGLARRARRTRRPGDVDVLERAALRVRDSGALREAPLPGGACAAVGRHSGNVAREALAHIGADRLLPASSLLVLAEFVAHDAADLADRGVRLERGADRLEQVARPARRLAKIVEPPPELVLVAVLLERLQALDLLLFGLRVYPEDLDVVLGLRDVLVDAHDDILAACVALVVAPGGLLDLRADVRDALDRAAQLLDLVDQ